MVITVRFTNSLADVDLTNAAPGDFYILPNGEIFSFDANQLGGIGSFFRKLGVIALPLAGVVAAPFTGGMSLAASTALSSALTAGGTIAAGLLGGAGGGAGGGGLAKGLAGITAYGNSVIAALDQVLQSGQIDAQILQQAEALVNSLSDGTKVYQAKKGADAAALQGFKTQGAEKLKRLRALAAQVQTVQQQQQQQQQQQSGGGIFGGGNTNGGILGGGSSTTLFLIGGVIAVIYLLKK